jgi:phosphoglycerate dehydrogenase-like enzyme
MPKLVIYPAIDAERHAKLQAIDPRLTMANCESLPVAMSEITDADGFFGKLTPELLAASTKLTWVQSPTASLEHYLFPELIEHPCQLSNMRGLFSDVIADHVLGLVLCFARQLHVYIRQQQSRTWAPVGNAAAVTDFVSGPGQVSAVDRAHQHLGDLTLGVVGAGAIGAEVLRRAAAFGMSLRAVDPLVRSIPGVLAEVWPSEQLHRLLQECDYVVIAAPHTPETEGLFDRPRLQQMRRTAVLINIGRGAIVRLSDLTAALQAGELAGAALDVCETEPLPADHPLWAMEQVIITPHVAAASPRIAERHLATLVENVRRFVHGEPPATLVNKRAWY